MRQLGTLANEKDAQRLSAWLLTQQIEAHAEPAGDRWAVWVREEDQVAAAKSAFEEFVANPDSEKFQGAERAAQALSRQNQSRRREGQGNIVEMRRRWGNPGGSFAGGPRGAPRRSPLTMLLIATTIVVAIITWNDTMHEAAAEGMPSSTFRRLIFFDPWAGGVDLANISLWSGIRAGELWRLVTPIFIHFGIPHLAFNMLCLHSFASQIEDRRGSRFLLALVLVLAVASNLGQAVEQTLRAHIGVFGGMSGVCYGLFGYLLVKTRYDNSAGYYLPPQTVFIALLWFALCIARDIPPFSELLGSTIPRIANSAHAVGLVVGAALAAMPLALRRAI